MRERNNQLPATQALTDNLWVYGTELQQTLSHTSHAQLLITKDSRKKQSCIIEAMLSDLKQKNLYSTMKDIHKVTNLKI